VEELGTLSPTADQVQAHRVQYETSLQQAKKFLVGQELRRVLSSGPSQRELREVLMVLVDELYPKDPSW